MKPILEIASVSKRYRLRHERHDYESLRESMMNIFRSNVTSEEFYALNEVSFNVHAGESIGIIGKNGAGKSTLLKILSRITYPTSGKITVRGRIASLLEVGTGFHPELSGRENIYLNGSILGMLRKEIERKFDEIVDFSGTERFLDTPLKHFSSGMQLRLAFAVAAFLEPEILIIDEVLAVGDAEFQKRCIGKMEAVSKSGRTILFVSHNMGAVQALCNKGIYLKNGAIDKIGPTSEVIQHYLNDQPFTGSVRNGSGKVHHITEVHSDQSAGQVEIDVTIESAESAVAALDVRLTTINMEPAGFGSLGTFNPDRKIQLAKGRNKVRFVFNAGTLANGLYYLSLDLTDPDKEYFDRAEQVLMIEIANAAEVQHGRSMQLDWKYGPYKIDITRTP
jgi:lipopolysaccharide transport system ATP-binding protein